jgi:hypothetical protein
VQSYVVEKIDQFYKNSEQALLRGDFISTAQAEISGLPGISAVQPGEQGTKDFERSFSRMQSIVHGGGLFVSYTMDVWISRE